MEWNGTGFGSLSLRAGADGTMGWIDSLDEWLLLAKLLTVLLLVWYGIESGSVSKNGIVAAAPNFLIGELLCRLYIVDPAV